MTDSSNNANSETHKNLSCPGLRKIVVSIFIAISVEVYLLTFAIVIVSRAKLLQATGARTSEKSVLKIKESDAFCKVKQVPCFQSLQNAPWY